MINKKEQEVQIWWNTNRLSVLWSGAIQGLYWNELWSAAREELINIYFSNKEK